MEEYTPVKRNGFYVLADRAVDPQHNERINEFYVKDLEAVAARICGGGVSLRTQGHLSGQKNLISAGEIDIQESANSTNVAKAVDQPDDPLFSSPNGRAMRMRSPKPTYELSARRRGFGAVRLQ